jgi:signal transduction histidine kinase/DNA-binding response OmpR family regulator
LTISSYVKADCKLCVKHRSIVMHKTGRMSLTIMTAMVIAMSFLGVVALWLYSNPDISKFNREDVFVTLMQLMVIIPICLGIILFSARYTSNQKESNQVQKYLEQTMQKLAAELDAEKSRTQAAQFQNEQINRQLELSVTHANAIAQQAAEAHKTKGQFLSNMSHQIRTPMNAIIGFSEMLAEENLDDEQKKQVKVIRDSSRHLLQLINDILDFSKIEAGKLDLDMTEITVDSILSSVESLMKPAATEKGLQFEIIKNQPLPRFIHTDPSRFKQCLINLVGNAVKFTHKGFIRITVSGESQEGKGFIRFDIEDSGIGIAVDKLENIFEPFAHVESGDSIRPFGGTGLGLVITKHILELLGGKITVKSTFEKGSTFSLFAPAVVESKQPAGDNKELSAESAPAKIGYGSNVKLKGRVLIVEDSPTNQMLIDLLLKKLGLVTDLAENGLQAVQKTAIKRYDVILMDILMPVMNGYEATKQIRINGIDTPIIALTACAMKGDDEKCFAAGCNEYLSKPADRKKLVDVLAKYLSVEGPKHLSQINQNNTQEKKEPVMQPAEVVNNVEQSEIEVDWQLLMERIGDEDLIDEILPIFLKDNVERMKLLEDAVKKNDSKEVKFFAHSIKGASGAIGASNIFELGKDLEYAARDEQTEKYAPLFEKIKLHFDNLLAFLENKDWKQRAKAVAENHNHKNSQ